MNHAKRNPGIPKRPNPQKNAKVVLARILGVYQEPPASAAPVTVNQVNIGSNNALEAVKRLAFAIAKAQHSQALEPPTIEGNAGVAGRNE